MLGNFAQSKEKQRHKLKLPHGKWGRDECIVLFCFVFFFLVSCKPYSAQENRELPLAILRVQFKVYKI